MIYILKHLFCSHVDNMGKLIARVQQSQIVGKEMVAEARQFLEFRNNVFDKSIHSRQTELRKSIFSKLIDKDQLSEIMLMIAKPHLVIQTAISKSILDYMIQRYDKLNIFQKAYLSYYGSILRNVDMYHLLKSEVTCQIDQCNQKQQVGLLFTYSQLMNQPNDHHYQLVSRFNNFKGNISSAYQKQLYEIWAYFESPKEIVINPKHGLKHKRSKLEIEVECILKTIGVDALREVELYCFQVDFLVLPNVVIQVNGPIHYVGRNRLKGTQIVRRKILESKGYKLIQIGYEEWQQLKGIRNQIQYMRLILRK